MSMPNTGGQPSLSPENMPFDTYLRERPNLPGAAATYAYDCVALARAILLQQRVHAISSDAIVALASLIESRDRAIRP